MRLGPDRCEGRPCVDMARRRQPSAHQGKRPRRKPTLPASWAQVSSLQNCDKINFCYLSHPLCGTCWALENEYNRIKQSYIRKENNGLTILKLFLRTRGSPKIIVFWIQVQMIAEKRSPSAQPGSIGYYECGYVLSAKVSGKWGNSVMQLML